MTEWKGRKAAQLAWPKWMSIPRDDRLEPEQDHGPLILAIIVILALAVVGVITTRAYAQPLPVPKIGSTSSNSQSSAKTTCYQVGNTTRCDTTGHSFNETTRCYPVGNTMRCDTTTTRR